MKIRLCLHNVRILESHPSRRGCHMWKLQNQLFVLCGQFAVLLASSGPDFRHALDWFAAAGDQVGMQIIEVQAPCGFIHK